MPPEILKATLPESVKINLKKNERQVNKMLKSKVTLH